MSERELVTLTPSGQTCTHAPALPSSWCVVVCEQGCGETWTVDTRDWVPVLTAADVAALLEPVLLDHERTVHGR